MTTMTYCLRGKVFTLNLVRSPLLCTSELKTADPALPCRAATSARVGNPGRAFCLLEVFQYAGDGDWQHFLFGNLNAIK